MADYFDEDDLINDFIEEDEEEGYPYEEDYHAATQAPIPEEQDKDDGEPTAKSTALGNLDKFESVSAPLFVEDGGDVGDDDDVGMEDAIKAGERMAASEFPSMGDNGGMFGEGGMDVDDAINTRLDSRSKIENKLYSFERFQTSREWRSAPQSQRDPLSQKQASKKRQFHLLSSTKRQKKKTPDVQLLEYVSLRSDSLSNRYRKNSSSSGPNKRFCYSGSSHPMENTSSTAITTRNDERIHVISHTPWQNEPTTNTTEGNLLDTDMTSLLDKSEALQRAKKRPRLITTPPNSSPTTPTPNNQLWVDKYAPSKFLHLLSNDRTNRLLLHALKPQTSSPVILLCGPPGVGKTTLARIAANHMNYRPVEINASDTLRSVQNLKDVVIAGMDNRTLEDMSISKRKCFILDEADGMDVRTAKVLADWIKLDREGLRPKVKCPIVMIANQKYATPLRSVLPHVEVLDVTSPDLDRIVRRIQAILSLEGYFCEKFVLKKWADESNGDIRSCLGSLQFVLSKYLRKSNKGATNSSMVDVSRELKEVLSGKKFKDERTELGNLLRVIFRRKKDVRTKHILSAVERFNDPSKTLDALFLNLPLVAYTDPSLDRTSAACECLSLADTFRNSTLPERFTVQKWQISPTAVAIHLLCRVESNPQISASMRTFFDQKFALQKNRGLLSKFVEGLTPSSKACENVLVMDVLPFICRLLGNGGGLLGREVSSMDVMQKSEKMAFFEHVRRLRGLGLTWKAEDNGGDEEMEEFSDRKLRLEPEIDRISTFVFKDENKRDNHEIPTALKQLLAQAAHVELMREREKITVSKQATPNTIVKKDLKKITQSVDPLPKANEEKEEKITNVVKNKNTPQNFLGIHATKAKAARKHRNASRVWKNKSSSSLVSAKMKLSYCGSGIPQTSVLRYKYRKGFTQAVRVPCRMEDLL